MYFLGLVTIPALLFAAALAIFVYAMADEIWRYDIKPRIERLKRWRK